ncbi:MAG: sporulation inhibitor of replication protein SirA [Firmicutes bacterium]|nr:sporulation inhibitor of replication protein SirA [Bacillota bacterium]
MRTYYIFNVNKEMSILTKDSPYMLFKSFESIYQADRNDLGMASNLYEQLASKFNKNILNQKIVNEYRDNQHYMYTKDRHTYYNKYKDETCNLTVKNSYIICNSNNSRLELLKRLSGFNLFACDFENKDYFWLDEIYC